VCIGYAKNGGWDILDFGNKRLKPIDYRKVKVDRRSGGCSLRMLVSPDLGPAAAHLLHAVALPVHGTAAGAFFLAHRTICHAGHQGRCGQEQNEDREDASQTAHADFSICLPLPTMWRSINGEFKSLDLAGAAKIASEIL
jgi:hypothetical protein